MSRAPPVTSLPTSLRSEARASWAESRDLLSRLSAAGSLEVERLRERVRLDVRLDAAFFAGGIGVSLWRRVLTGERSLMRWARPRRGVWLRHPVDFEQIRPELLLREPGGDPDQISARGDARLLREPGAVVEQRAQARPVLGQDAPDPEQQLEASHGLDPRRDRQHRDPG